MRTQKHDLHIIHSLCTLCKRRIKSRPGIKSSVIFLYTMKLPLEKNNALISSWAVDIL
jgi:hypothetical protein